jgi:CMP-N-acetylneuraminic acid synthetase
MKTFAFIFARGGSQGLKGKNIKPLVGKPLIAYSIEVAQQLPQVAEVYVSTDSESIAETARSFGSKVIMRPDYLATADSPEWLAWKHAVHYLDSINQSFEIFLSLPATSPLRLVGDIEECLNALDDKTDLIMTMMNSRRSPWFNMVKEVDGFIEILLKNQGEIARRQDAPISYDLTTIARVCRADYIRNASGLLSGKIKGLLFPPDRSVDIDDEFDFLIAETLMKQRLRTTC